MILASHSVSDIAVKFCAWLFILLLYVLVTLLVTFVIHLYPLALVFFGY